MTLPATNGQYSFQIEAHEDRLQRVEATLQEVVSMAAETRVKLDFMAQRADEQNALILDKLKTGYMGLGEKVVELEKAEEACQIESRVQAGKLKELEAKERARNIRSANLKKILIPLALAAGGVVAGKLGELLWIWLSR